MLKKIQIGNDGNEWIIKTFGKVKKWVKVKITLKKLI